MWGGLVMGVFAKSQKSSISSPQIDEELAVVMDKLASESATGIHSTKKQRSATAM